MNLIIKTANKLNKPKGEIEAISLAYDAISRFSGFTGKMVDNAIVEIKLNKKNDYEELPLKLVETVKNIIKKDGDVAKFFNPYLKDKNFLSFAKKFYERRFQPKDFYIKGIITFRHLKHSVNEDRTVEVSFYDYDGKAA